MLAPQTAGIKRHRAARAGGLRRLTYSAEDAPSEEAPSDGASTSR